MLICIKSHQDENRRNAVFARGIGGGELSPIITQILYIILIDLYRRFLYHCAAFCDASHTHFFKDYTQTKFYHSHVKMLIDLKYDVRTKDEY